LETQIQVLSEQDRHDVHESSLYVLENTGVRVDTALGRQYLQQAGAEVDPNTNIVYLPQELVENAIKMVPKEFSLGARRPEWKLEMNKGECSLVADGEGISIIDRDTGKLRPTTYQDWLQATRLIDALDDIGVYWTMVVGAQGSGSLPEMVRYWRMIFANFTKHVQDSLSNKDLAPWFLEVLQVIFGDKASIREQHPFSFLICPQSPLVIEEQYTDTYLALRDWNIPAAIMPMPLMGGTAPGNKISTVVLGNSETLAMLTLIQAAAPGTPVIYAPVLAVMNPRTGLYSGGAIENGVLSSAAVEMARYYQLPAEATGGGTDQYLPGVQAGYERALTSIMPILSWPDLYVGPGLLGGSMILSMEQILIDIEIYRMNQQASRGILTDDEKWLDEVIEKVGPAGSYLGERSTVQGIRSGTWLVNRMGVHTPLKAWEAAGRPTVEDHAREMVDEILTSHRPIPFPEDVERGLEEIYQKALASAQG
jgi:trimethylamine--corrinoid protein Co-methyltransferase